MFLLSDNPTTYQPRARTVASGDEKTTHAKASSLFFQWRKPCGVMAGLNMHLDLIYGR